MSEPKKPSTHVPLPEADEYSNFRRGEERESISPARNLSDLDTGQEAALPRNQMDDLSFRPEQFIYLSESDYELFLAALDSDERPDETLWQAAERYACIEEDLERLDELELSEMVSMAREARAAGDTVSHEDVKKRLGLDEREPEKRRRGDGGD